MKCPLPLLLAVLAAGAPATAGAFTFMSSSLGSPGVGATPVTVPVSGYGSLVFVALGGSSLVLDSSYQNDNGFGGPSLNFDNGESLQVTFQGPQPLNVDFDFVGLSVGESFLIQPDPVEPQAFLLTFQGSGDGAGLYAISWQAIPEPASAAGAVLGAAVLALRRRR